MSNNHVVTGSAVEHKVKKNILLALLPFWNPLIPPLGLACLKAFLEPHNYSVRTIDANIEQPFRSIYDRYFGLLEEIVPETKRGNFHNIGMDVMRNQLMAHLHYKTIEEYQELIQILIRKTFFHETELDQVNLLIQLIEEFYALLETYVLEQLDKYQPDIFGVSVFDGTLPAAMYACRLAKEKYPQMKTVMGGGIFADDLKPGSPNFDHFLEITPYIEKIIVGEGEKLFLKVLEEELYTPQRVYNFKDTEGKSMDIKTAVIPDFSDFQLEFYPHMTTYTSRSCPFMCSFCSETVMWGNFRKKDSKQIVNELTTLYQNHGKQLFLMGDSLLNPVIHDLALEFAKTDLSIYWDGHLRVEKRACSTETTLQWRRGGFYRARMGIESGSQNVLNMMDKKITVEQIKSTLYSLAYAGIKTTTFWVVGHPGETEEDFLETLQLIEENKDNIYEAWSSPFNYYFSGQVNSDTWQKEAERVLRYPAEARDMLIVQSWDLEVDPRRAEIYSRLNRFVQHCNRLGVPTSISTMHDVYLADERWKSLHKNAVPSLLEFQKSDGYLEENKGDKSLLLASGSMDIEGNWNL